MREFQDVPPGGPGGSGEKAGPGKRFLARFIDGIILLIPSILVTLPFGGFAMGTGGGDDAGKAFVGGVVATLLSFGYFVFLESSQGATPGKKIMGYRMVGAGGGNPTTAEAAKRNAWMLLQIVPVIGGLAVLAIAIAIGVGASSDPEGVSYHDRWAGVRPELTK